MSEVKLLPLPEGEAIGWSQAWSHDQMHDYARANMEPLIAENERLRADAERYRFIAADHSAAWEEELDAAIDQARGKGGAGK